MKMFTLDIFAGRNRKLTKDRLELSDANGASFAPRCKPAEREDTDFIACSWRINYFLYWYRFSILALAFSEGRNQFHSHPYCSNVTPPSAKASLTLMTLPPRSTDVTCLLL